MEMNNTSRYKNIKGYKHGFSLVEIIVVVAIIVILVSVTAPCFFTFIGKTKEVVCNINCLKLERMYNLYLNLENIEHSDVVFVQYLQKYGGNICPDKGDITYVDGKVRCSVHKSDDEQKNDDDADVPFL